MALNFIGLYIILNTFLQQEKLPDDIKESEIVKKIDKKGDATIGASR